jgi:pimeloyl-ACP methyl ester carboxylesterase
MSALAMATLAVPSVHVVGTASPLDPAVTRATAALSPDASLIELDCGHFPWIERPGSVTDAVRALPLPR